MVVLKSFQILNIILLGQCGSDYRFLEFESCINSQEEIAKIETCVVSPTTGNLTIDFKKPLSKFFVRNIEISKYNLNVLLFVFRSTLAYS